ncbi:MAG TPA: AMP-binding protein, partial [Polyangiaceae bacterium]|nr:AMP-binding protein [Polyangiaceae bacterium]
MSELLHELPLRSAHARPSAPALVYKGRVFDYGWLADQIERCAAALVRLGLGKLERVGVYLPKQPENVVGMFGAPRAGMVFVPINPLLKPMQVGHILRDCNVRVLITSPERATSLAAELAQCPDLRHLVIVGGGDFEASAPNIRVHRWDALLDSKPRERLHRVIDADVVSIFYTSGSTGKPKGVVLSH